MTIKEPINWPTTLEATIDSLAQGGAGVGRWDARPVFVAGALPGERVRVQLSERRDGWARGAMIELLGEPAPQRITPPCPVFGTCGGCDWQYHHIEAQRVGKTAIVAEQLRHVGRQAHAPLLPMAQRNGPIARWQISILPATPSVSTVRVGVMSWI